MRQKQDEVGMMRRKVLMREFWDWFTDKEDLLVDAHANQPELIAQVLGKLKTIEPMLVCDLGLPVDEERREFIISAQGVRAMFPIVMELVDAAPKLVYWQVKGFRPRRPQHMKVTYEGAEVDSSDVFFEHKVSRKNIFEVRVYYLDSVLLDKRHYETAKVMIQNMLGEYDTATRCKLLGVFNVEEAEDMNKLQPLIRIGRIFDEEMGSN